MYEVPVFANPVAPFGQLLQRDQLAEFEATMGLARQQLAGRTAPRVAGIQLVKADTGLQRLAERPRV